MIALLRHYMRSRKPRAKSHVHLGKASLGCRCVYDGKAVTG